MASSLPGHIPSAWAIEVGESAPFRVGFEQAELAQLAGSAEILAGVTTYFKMVNSCLKGIDDLQIDIKPMVPPDVAKTTPAAKMSVKEFVQHRGWFAITIQSEVRSKMQQALNELDERQFAQVVSLVRKITANPSSAASATSDFPDDADDDDATVVDDVDEDVAVELANASIQIEKLKRDNAELSATLNEERATARAKIRSLSENIEDLESALEEQATKAENLSRNTRKLTARLDEESDRLSELQSSEAAHANRVAQLEAERTMLLERVQRAEDAASSHYSAPPSASTAESRRLGALTTLCADLEERVVKAEAELMRVRRANIELQALEDDMSNR